MTNSTIIQDLTIAINLDGFTRLQMKHMLLTIVATMTTEQAEALLATMNMDANDLDL